MNTLLKLLRRKEKHAYPSFMRQLQYIYKWEDLQEYCESSQVEVHLLGRRGYIIMTPTEIVDLVVLEPNQIFGAYRCIRRHYGIGSRISLDCRENTSWKIVKFFQDRGKIKLHMVSPWTWGNETMYEVEIEIKG
jgi:hypothetical protein